MSDDFIDLQKLSVRLNWLMAGAAITFIALVVALTFQVKFIFEPQYTTDHVWLGLVLVFGTWKLQKLFGDEYTKLKTYIEGVLNKNNKDNKDE